MKKLILMLGLGTFLSLAACTDPHQTGGAQQDAGASHGNSGPADTAMTAGSGSPIATPTGGSDTSKNGQGVSSPSVDSARH